MMWSLQKSTSKVGQLEKLLETKLLELDTHDVRMIGIWGMGVSKSSLYGLNKLQQQVPCNVLSNENITVSSVHEGTNKMKNLLRGRKVLIVLDDVDDIEQLEALVAHRVKFINGVNLLLHVEAIPLFSKYAFIRDIPIERYDELLKQVVQYAHGLPLTIKVLGSLLCGQNVPQWLDTIERLKIIPLKATLEKLKLSYNGLEEDCKEIFLDVACLLKDGELDMHDHIVEMGRNIVRHLNPNEPERHRMMKLKILWLTTWFLKCTLSMLRTLDLSVAPNLETIILKDCYYLVEVHFQAIPNLKELRIYDCKRLEKLHMRAESPKLRSLNLLDSKLRTLHLGITLNLEILRVKNCIDMVELHMPAKCLELVDLNLSNLKLTTLHLPITPNLKTASLQDCLDLVELHMPAECPKLV
ncbi:Toll/interleukin-1 receptor domain-containing protein [Tanacetum coccineum]